VLRRLFSRNWAHRHDWLGLVVLGLEVVLARVSPGARGPSQVVLSQVQVASVVVLAHLQVAMVIVALGAWQLVLVRVFPGPALAVLFVVLLGAWLRVLGTVSPAPPLGVLQSASLPMHFSVVFLSALALVMAVLLVTTVSLVTLTKVMLALLLLTLTMGSLTAGLAIRLAWALGSTLVKVPSLTLEWAWAS